MPIKIRNTFIGQLIDICAIFFNVDGMIFFKRKFLTSGILPLTTGFLGGNFFFEVQHLDLWLEKKSHDEEKNGCFQPKIGGGKTPKAPQRFPFGNRVWVFHYKQSIHFGVGSNPPIFGLTPQRMRKKLCTF